MKIISKFTERNIKNLIKGRNNMTKNRLVPKCLLCHKELSKLDKMRIVFADEKEAHVCVQCFLSPAPIKREVIK